MKPELFYETNIDSYTLVYIVQYIFTYLGRQSSRYQRVGIVLGGNLEGTMRTNVLKYLIGYIPRYLDTIDYLDIDIRKT